MGTPQSDPQNPTPAPAAEPAPPAQPAAPALPPAAVVVVEGKTPREIELEQKLEQERQARKGDELTVAQLKEDLHKLRQVTPPAPRKKKGCLESFFEGEA